MRHAVRSRGRQAEAEAGRQKQRQAGRSRGKQAEAEAGRQKQRHRQCEARSERENQRISMRIDLGLEFLRSHHNKKHNAEW